MATNATLDSIRLLSYDITFEPLNTYPRSRELENVIIQMQNLLDSDPKEAQKQLQIIIEKYPNDPTLNGYLANAHAFTEGIKSAKPLIIKNYQQFPDYFFARYMYIELCLHEENLENAAKAFDGKFDLKLSYPHRSVFHISELLGFSKICAHYFYAIDKADQAKMYIEIIQQMDDEHPFLKYLETAFLYYSVKNLLKKKTLRRKRMRKNVKPTN